MRKIELEQNCVKFERDVKVVAWENSDGSLMFNLIDGKDSEKHLICISEEEANKLCNWWLEAKLKEVE